MIMAIKGQVIIYDRWGGGAENGILLEHSADKKICGTLG